MRRLILSFATIIFFSDAFADEALWLRYASISPDGKQIAFSYKGDIYKVSSSGGEAKQLTVHEAYDAYPIWSNDAQRITFASKRFGNYDIFIMSSEGGKTTRLTYHSSNDYPCDFSKDNSKIIFTSARLDAQSSVLHPSGVLSEAYMVADSGGRVEQVITTPAEDIQFSPDGKKIIYHDRKGYENSFRKHHTSSITRDILIYDLEAKKYQKVVDWMGEDRNPIWKNNEEIYFLSERSGSFNVWKTNISSGSEKNSSQISRFETHPLRYLSSSDEGTLCYTFDGALYTQKEGEEPKRIIVEVKQDERYNESIVKLIKGGAKDFAVSPNGKEIAFIVRGELFVTSVEYGNTKRITNTPEQERSPDFNEDGSKLVYAGERDGSWNIYEASLDRKEDKYFYNATIINEKVLIKTNKETF